MNSVTVQSSALGQYVTVPFASIENLPLARQIAAAISSEVESGVARSVVSGNRPPPRLSECETGVFFQVTSGVTYLPRGYDGKSVV